MKSIFTFVLTSLFLLIFNPIFSQDIYELIMEDRVADGPSYALGVSENTVAYGDGAILKIFDLPETGDPTLASQIEVHSLIRDIVIEGGYLYLAADEVGVMMFDIADRSSPVLYRSYPSVEYEFQLVVIDQYVYLSDDTGSLKVIDMEDPSGPMQIEEFELGNKARELILRDDKLIATTYGKVFLFDVSDPALPVEIMNMEGNNFSDGDIVDHKLYLTDHDTLHIYDITDVSNPELLEKFDSGATRMVKIEIVGNYLYAVGSSGRYTIYEIAPDNVINFVGQTVEGGYYLNIEVMGDISFVIGVRYGLIMINNFEKNNPELIFHDENGSFVYGMDIQGNVCYIANEFDGLRIYDIDGDNNLVLTGELGFSSGGAYQVEVDGNYAYIAKRQFGMSIIDVSDKYNPLEIASLELDGRTNDLEVRGPFLYLAQRDVGLIIVDKSDPLNLIELGRYSMTGDMYNLDVQGSYAYVANSTDGLVIIDVSDPNNPELASVYNDDVISGIVVMRARDVEVVDNTAYLADFGNGFHIIDVTDKENPVQISNEIDYSSSTTIKYKNDKIYLGRNLDGISIFDISDPLLIKELDTYDTGGRVDYVALSGNHIMTSEYYCGFNLFSLLVTTSTADLPDDNLETVNVFPNPASINFSIEIELPKSSFVKVSILDVNGQNFGVLYKGKHEKGQQTIDIQNGTITNLKSGVYLLNIAYGNHQIFKPLVIE